MQLGWKEAQSSPLSMQSSCVFPSCLVRAKCSCHWPPLLPRVASGSWLGVVEAWARSSADSHGRPSASGLGLSRCAGWQQQVSWPNLGGWRDRGEDRSGGQEGGGREVRDVPSSPRSLAHLVLPGWPAGGSCSVSKSTWEWGEKRTRQEREVHPVV